MSRAVRVAAIALAFAACGDDARNAGAEPDRDRELIAAAYGTGLIRAAERGFVEIARILRRAGAR